MTQALLAAGGLFLLVYVPLAALAWRRPLLARFAWREAIRSRSQFVLLVVGLMVGSASISASLVAGDSGIQTFASLSDQRLGAVDLTVTRAGGATFPIDIARQLAADPSLSTYIDGVQAGVEVPASVADLDRRLGKSNVLLVGFDPDSQWRFGAYTLTDGRRVLGGELAPGDVVLSRGLASALDARAGDHLRMGTGSNGGVALRVYGIADAVGPGAYGAFLAAYMTLSTAQLVMNDQGINVVRIAARQGTSTDTESARRAAAPLRAAVSRIAAGTPLVVNEVRSDEAAQMQGTTAAVLGPYLGFSALTVLAAIALIVNLVLALADERRSRLAVLRALGLTRAGLVGLFVLEGAVYSLAAATVGVAAGVPAGLYLAGQLWNAGVTDPTDQALAGFQLQLSVRPGTLALAFAAGALITLGTVAAAAFRTSRMAIAAAIRDLPDPASAPRHRWPRAALLVTVAALGAALLLPDDLRSRLVGGVALIATVAALARGRLPDRARFTLAGLLLAAWAGILVAGARGTSDLYQMVTVIFLAVATAAVGLSIAAAANLRLIDAAIGLVGNRAGLLQATLRPPMAYLSRRPVRTGLATSAFALVLTLVSGIAFVAAAPRPDYARESAGFDVEVVTSGPNPILLPHVLEAQVAAEMALPMRLYRGPVGGQGLSHPGPVGGRGSSVVVVFYVLPAQPNGAGPVVLSSRDKRFASDAEVWQALRTDPHLAVDAQAGLGNPVTLQGVNGPIQFRVAGHEGPIVLQGIIVSPAALAGIDTQPAGSTLLVKAKAGSDPRVLARQIERALFDQGVQATTIRDILDQDYAGGIDYTTEFDVLLHMGLLVGVLALGMIGVRAAIERRRAIGILRALGYEPLRLLAGLLAEATMTATIGVVTGIGAGLLLAYVLIAGSRSGTHDVGVAFVRLGIALAIVYGTVLIVTLPLVSRASRMAPAEAIRLSG
jgi:putative ABC transport system permease protein